MYLLNRTVPTIKVNMIYFSYGTQQHVQFDEPNDSRIKESLENKEKLY